MNEKLNPEAENIQQFFELRHLAHQQSDLELAERIKNNPLPTSDESQLGLFAERLEPQVRDAIMDLHRKGYHTMSSGFVPQNPQEQVICFYNDAQLTPEHKKYIEQSGAKIETQPFRDGQGYYWEISFMAPTPDLSIIKTKWDKIASLMPKTEYTPWRSKSADKFEKDFPTH